MKASVIISNGKTTIVLTPENEFEIDVIERTIDNKYKIKNTTVHSDYGYHSHTNHKIILELESK